MRKGSLPEAVAEAEESPVSIQNCPGCLNGAEVSDAGRLSAGRSKRSLHRFYPVQPSHRCSGSRPWSRARVGAATLRLSPATNCLPSPNRRHNQLRSYIGTTTGLSGPASRGWIEGPSPGAGRGIRLRGSAPAFKWGGCARGGPEKSRRSLNI